MAGWILAAGRDAESVVADEAQAGATTIALVNADIIFTAGDLLFISESDGSETEWLGRVTQLTSMSIGFSRPLRSSKNTGAKLWRAASAIGASEAALPARRTRQSGVITERSLGGRFYAVRVAEPTETFTLELGGLTPAAARAITSWLDDADAGLNALALLGPSGELMSARMSGEPIVRETGRGDMSTIKLPLILVAEEIYP
ncbi:hypothetical protein LLG95_04165 [bacterium]|nr:hypothetical protein [bacterium]